MRNHLVVIFLFNILSHCFAQVQVQQNVANTNLAQNQVQQSQGTGVQVQQNLNNTNLAQSQLQQNQGGGVVQVQQNVGNTNVAQNQLQQNTGNQGQGNQGPQALAGAAVTNQGTGNQNQPGQGSQNNNQNQQGGQGNQNNNQNQQGNQGSQNNNQNQGNQGNQNWNPNLNQGWNQGWNHNGGWNNGQQNWNNGQQNWNNGQQNWNNGQQNWNNNNNGQNQIQNYQPANRQNLNVGNPDRGNITRPCQPYDMNCIRKFFTEHSYCKPSYGPVPEPYFRKRDIQYLPRINVTATVYDERLMGLNGRVEDFFINIDTDKLVIVIEFRGLNVASNKTYIRIHRRAREPIIVKTYANVTYESLVVTTIIPQIYKLRLDKAVVFAFLNDPNPDYQIGPEFTKSDDPTVQRTEREFRKNQQANVGEIFLTSATFFPTTFIQYNICDFGLKLI